MRLRLYASVFPFAVLLSVCAAMTSCEEDDGLPRIDLAHYYEAAEGIVSGDNRYDKWFDSYHAVFLEGTDSSGLSDYVCMAEADGRAVLLLDGRIRAFDVRTGKESGCFLSGEGASYSGLDIDMEAGMLYALDAGNSRIDRFDMSGNLTGSLPLEEGYVYDKVAVIGHDLLLVTVRNYSGMLTFTADFNACKVSVCDWPETLDMNPSPENVKGIGYRCPELYTVCRNGDEVLVKYLFDDKVYRYGPDGRFPVFKVVSDGSVRFSGKGLRMKGDRIEMLSGIWRLDGSLWLIRHRLLRGGNYWNIFTICDADMSLFNNTIVYDSSWMYWESPVFSVHDIFLYDIIYVSASGRRIYKLTEYDSDMTLPPDMRESREKDGIIMCVYDIREGLKDNLKPQMP